MAALAVLTTALQIDKQSDITPSLAAAVPPPLRDYAQTRVTLAALEAGDPAIALAAAEVLVQRRPVPAEYLSLLAIAQARAGQAEQAALTIQIAGQRGWREPLAQEAVLRLALAAGDKPEAARRYAALMLHSAAPNAVLQELGEQVFDEAGGPGRQTMIDIVSAAERWQSRFLRRGQAVIEPDAFAEIIAGSVAQGSAFDCPVLEQAVRALGRRNEEAARSLAPTVETCRRN